MAQKKIDIKFNIDDKSVKIAGEETMKLSQQVRLLKAELASGKYSQEEFQVLATKLGDVEDQMAKTKVRSGDLFTSLQLIPGPIGDIASKINGTIALMKTFSGFSFKDLKFQFKETLTDVKDIGKSLADATGLSSLFGKSVQATQDGFNAVGDGVNVATKNVGKFSKALVATGIGAIVVAVGLLVAYWDDIVGLVNGVSTEQEELNSLTQENLDIETKKLKDLDGQTNQLKLQGKSEKEILQLKIQQSNQNILAAEAAIEQAEITKNAQVEASQRNKDILKGLLNFISLPITMILGTIDAISVGLKELGVIDEALTLRDDILDYTASFVFDPEEVKKTGEATVQTQKDTLNALKEQNAGFQLASRDIDKAAADKKTETTKDNGAKELEAQKILADAELQLKSKQAQDEAAVEADYQAKLLKLKEAGIEDDGNLLKVRDAKLKEIRDKVVADDEKVRQDKLKKEQDLQNQLRKIETSRTETLMDDAQLEIDIVNQKYTALIEAATRNKEDITLLQQLQAAEIKTIQDTAAKGEIELDKKVTEEKKNELLARQTAQFEFAQALGSAFGALSGLLKEGTNAAKAAALAEIAIGTGVGFINALDIAQKSAKGTGPAAAFAFPIFYATQIAAVLAAASRAKSILKSGGGGSGGGNSPEPAPAPITAAPTGVAARRNQGGFVYGDGGSITDSIPTMLSDGEFVMNSKSSALFSPMLSAMNSMGNLPNTSLPQSPGNQSLVDIMTQNTNNRPIKTYVTAQDMSNQQQFDRTIKSRSLI
jgi:hypothetical protein